MKIPASLLAPFLVLAVGSCSSENDELIVPDSSKEKDVASHPTGENAAQTGPWSVSEDDNRTRLEACRLRMQEDLNSTSITAGWSEPVNASTKPFYRLEIAEGEEFTTSYAAFPNLTETLFKIGDLKPNTGYYIRLQAYLGPDLGPNDVDLAPSIPEIAHTTTALNPLNQLGNLELRIDYGKFSAKWDPPTNASGKLEYLVYLHTDESLENALDIRTLKEPLIKDWIVAPEQDYWLVIQALPDPDSTNVDDNDSPALIKQFRVPGNQLDTPENFKVIMQQNTIRLSWDPISNNHQDFEYLLMVYVDGNRTESFGEYHLDEPGEIISGVKQNPRYWFDLQAIPVSGNHVDAPSETVSSDLELPAITYATPLITEFKMEPIDDPEEPGTLVKLTWDNIANADGQNKFRVEIAEDEDFGIGFQDYEEDAGSLGGEYGPLDPGKTYYLRMRVVGPFEDATRNPSEWSEIRTFVTLGTPPPPPVEPNE
ncbi:MAG: fibronectin type III domain-containing protein [Opitutales bacterium]